MSENTNEKLPLGELERWKLFYNYTCEVYNNEEARYKRIEEKALSCLTAFSLLLVIYGFLWKNVLNDVIPPKCVAEVILSIFSVVLLLLFILSWIITFQTFQTAKRKIMPLHEDMIKYFKHINKDKVRSRNLAELYYDLGEINKEAFEDNCKITEEELRKFKLGFKMIRISAIVLIAFITMYATYLWCKCPLIF